MIEKDEFMSIFNNIVGCFDISIPEWWVRNQITVSLCIVIGVRSILNPMHNY